MNIERPDIMLNVMLFFNEKNQILIIKSKISKLQINTVE